MTRTFMLGLAMTTVVTATSCRRSDDASYIKDQVSPTTANAGASLVVMDKTQSLVTEYKTLTVNVFADNESVSSLPRNVRDLADRHAAWLREYVAFAGANRPDWTKIVDETSYRNALAAIGRIEARDTSDSVLTAAETKFLDDLQRLSDELVSLRTKLRQNVPGTALGDESNPLGEEGRTLGDAMTEAADHLEGMLKSVGDARAVIGDDIDKRRILKLAVPRLLRRYADLAVVKKNSDLAAQIIRDVDRVVREATVATRVYESLNGRWTRVSTYLNTFYSPLHARQAQLAALGVIAAQRAALAKESLSTSGHSQLEAFLGDQERSLQEMAGSIQNGIGRSKELSIERARLTKVFLDRSRAQLSTGCVGLADDIIAAAGSADRASEVDFIDFQVLCRGRAAP